MNDLRLLFLVFCLLGVMPIKAQKTIDQAQQTSSSPVVLSGKVVDAYSGKALSGVMVTIRPVGSSKILKFAKTQADGSYHLAGG